jgi:hypothetical protein
MAARKVQSLLTVSQFPSVGLISVSSPEELTTRDVAQADPNKQISVRYNTDIVFFTIPPSLSKKLAKCS